MNTFNIEFKNAKDLAKKIAEYNELLNGPKVQPMEPEPIKCVFVKNEPKEETTPKVVEEPKEEPAEQTKLEPVEVVEPVEEVAEVPVTNFEGEPVEAKAEEVEQPTETELDVDTAEVDPQVYWGSFKDWLKHVGAEGVKAALDVFRNHGVNGKPNSGDLTPEIMQELNALMGK